MSKNNGKGNANLFQNLAWLGAFVGGMATLWNVMGPPEKKEGGGQEVLAEEKVLVERTKLGKDALLLLGMQPKQFLSECFRDENGGILTTKLHVDLVTHLSEEYRAQYGNDLFEGEILRVVNTSDVPVTGLFFKDQASTVVGKYSGTLRPKTSLIVLTRLQFLTQKTSSESATKLDISSVDFVTNHHTFTRVLPPAPSDTEWSRLFVSNECGEIYSGSHH